MNPVVWFEIAVEDLERAKRFYNGMFGWTFERLEGHEPAYWTIRTEKGPAGGLVLQDEWRQPSGGVVLYVEVADLQRLAERALDLGGGLVQGSKRITPEAGSFALIHDPEGNLLGLWCA